MDIATLGLKVDEQGFVHGTNRAIDAVNRLGNAEKTSLAQHKRIYTERLATARASYRAEVEAAQRAMRERLRATTSSGEVRAAQDMYRKRVEAAQQAARAEVQLAQQAHIAATRGIRPMVDASDALVKSTNGARVTLNTLRSSMTTVAASALSAVPGVTQLTSAVGAMALGSAWMIGIMAGVAALGFAWNKLTEDARRLKEMARDAADAIQATADARRFGAFNGPAQNLGVALGQQEAARLRLAAARRGTTSQTAEGTVTIVNREAIAKAQADYDKWTQIVRDGQAEITRIQGEELRKRQEDLARGMALGIAEQERLNREAEKKEREHQERMASMAHYNRILRDERLMGTQFRMNVPQGTTTTSANGVTRFGDGRVLVGGNLPRQMTPATGGGFMSGVGATWDSFKSQFTASNIGATLATSGLNTAMNLAMSALGKIAGGVGRFVGGLFGFGEDADRAARRMRAAQQEFIRSLQDFVDGLSGMFDDGFLNARRQMQAFWTDFKNNFFRDLVEQAFRGNPFPSFNFQDAKSFEEMQAFIDGLIAQGGWSAEALAALELMSQAIRLSAGRVEELGEAARQTTQALRNVPEGFKVAYHRFNATTGDLVLPGGGVPLPPPRTGGGLIVTNNITVTAQPGQSTRDIAEEVVDIMERRTFVKTGARMN